MRGFRAKDADRDRYVEIIEAAYGDGQLGEQDRELRVSRALTAETLDELDALTRDLQVRSDMVVRPAPSRPGPQPGRVLAVIAALGALVVLMGGGLVGLVVLSATDGSEAGSPTVVVSSEAVPVPSDAGGAEAPSFAMTAPEVRRFLRAYEREFGTLDAYDVGFYPTRVGVQVPVRGSRPRFERWTWTGAWQQDTEASAVRGPGEVIDLGALEVRRLFANIATARTTLRVERGRLTHVLVNDWSEVPTVNIYIGNRFDESGYLKTTLSGEVLRSFPYDG